MNILGLLKSGAFMSSLKGKDTIIPKEWGLVACSFALANVCYLPDIAYWKNGNTSCPTLI